MATAKQSGAGLAAIGLTTIDFVSITKALLGLRVLEFGHYVPFSKLLVKFNIWTAINNAFLEDLSNDGSLIFLRLTLPTLDWRFDIKLSVSKWNLLFLWTVDGHTWVMKMTAHWGVCTLFALCLSKVLSLIALVIRMVNLLSQVIREVSMLQYAAYAKFSTSASDNTVGDTNIKCLGSDPDNKHKHDKSKDSKQSKYKKDLYNAVNEPDNGQETTNPYILVKRHMKSNNAVDLETLNSILAFHDISVTPEDFSVIQQVAATTLPYPIPAGDADVISIIGKANKKSAKVIGAYVLTFLEDNRQYVGGSKDLAKRVRYYYGSKGLLETRPVARLMAKHGPTAFSLKVYVMDTDAFKSPVTSVRTTNLVLALEQYLIMVLKPTLNGVLVVGGVSSSMSGSAALALVAAKKMKQVYVYNADMTKLVYISTSRADLEKDLNVHQVTINRRLTDGKPLLSTYILSDDQLETATVSLMTTNELRDSVAELYKNRMQLRDYSSKVNSNMHSIYLTDLKSAERKPMFFVSKSQAQQHTVKHLRSINIKQFNRELPFTLNNWLVESAKSHTKNPHSVII